MNEEKLNSEENKDEEDTNNEKTETSSCQISSNIDNLDKSFEIDEAEFDSF